MSLYEMRNTVAGKAVGFVAALALVASFAFAGAFNAQAQSDAEDLQAEIERLMALIETLQAEIEGETATDGVSGDFTPFTRPMGVGATGPEVQKLQEFLNANGFTVATTGAGSAGMESQYYGSLTAAAVSDFQVAYRSEILTPLGLSAGTGYWGNSSISKANELIAAGDADEDDDADEDEDEDEDRDLEGGEAELSVEIDSEDDLSYDVDEQHAFTIEVEADDQGGDALLNRVDLAFSVTGTGARTHEVIRAVTLEVDGDEIASEDTDSRGDWGENSDDHDYIRLSGLNQVVRSGETVEIAVLIDGGDEGETVVLESAEFRYTDGVGIIAFEESTSSQTVNIDPLDAVEFDLDEASDNPTSVTVSLNEDRDEVLLLLNEVEVDGQDGLLDEVYVEFTFDANVAAASQVAANDALEDLIDDVYYNGERADDLEVTDLDAGNFTKFVASFYDLDEEVEVGDEFEVEVVADFLENSAFVGTEFSVTNITFAGVGADDEDFSPSVTPDSAPAVTLTGGALVLDSYEADIEKLTDNEAEATFSVTLANEGDDDITFDVTDLGFTEPAGATYAYNYEVDGSSVTSVTVDGDSEETLDVSVIVDAAGGTSKYYELELDDVDWTSAAGTCSGADTASTNEADCLDAGVNGGAGTWTPVTGTLILNLESGRVFLSAN